MKKLFRRISSGLISALMLCTVWASVSVVSGATDDGVIFEIAGDELAKSNGIEPMTSIYDTQVPGYEGKTGFLYHTGDTLKFDVDAPEEGMYDVVVRYTQVLSEEGRQQTIAVNGSKYTAIYPYAKEWTDFNFGKIRLKKGENEFALVPEYGYAAYDSIKIKTADMPELKVAPVLCDKKATKETQSLMNYLCDVYGNGILSGQQTIYGGGHKVQTTIRYDAEKDKCLDSDGNEYAFDEADRAVADDGSKFVWHCKDKNGQVYDYDSQNRNYGYCEYDRELKYLKATVGDMAAIQGFDFGANCPCYQWDDGIVERMIDWTNNKNGICTASWHINVPAVLADYTLGEPLDFSKTTYSEKCDFSPSKAMEKGTPEYDYWQLCIKNLAEQLSKLQDAGVPVIFRPLHEADGNYSNGGTSWFWWGKEGPEVYNKLWKFLQKELTETYGIHNLIWEQNLYAWSPASAEWYSGDDCVDIVGYDKYNTQYNRHDGNTSGPNLDAESGIFWKLYDTVKGNKMVSMPENDTIPSLDNIMIEKAGWLYFCPWYDEENDPKFLSGENYQDIDEVKKIYTSDYCITLSELPDWKNYESGTPLPTQKPTEPTEPTTNADIDYILGDINGDKTVNVFDSVKLRKLLLLWSDPNIVLEPIRFPNVYDTNGDGLITVSDLVSLNRYLVGDDKAELTYYKESANQKTKNSIASQSQKVITVDEAKAAALTDADLKASAVTFTKTQLEKDNMVDVYDVEFYTQDSEYEYEINAADGTILEKNIEKRAANTTGASGDSSQYIGVEKAKSIALQHAGFTSSQVKFSEAELDVDSDGAEYEISFYKDNTEYDYSIDAVTGNVIECENSYHA